MKRSIFLIVFASILGSWFESPFFEWQSRERKAYILYFQTGEEKFLDLDDHLLAAGIKEIEGFFGEPFLQKFKVFIHPSRNSLDSTWSMDWKSPGFKSECWMVASGIATRIDLIAPHSWDSTSCEHKFQDSIATQQLITHELVHVYHGQRNPSGDFSETDHLDWLVEGMATWASGQLNNERIREVKENILKGNTPPSLDLFWTGKAKYGLSGSMLMYIDKKWGRSKIKEILKYQSLRQVLESLAVSESQLIEGWSSFFRS